jgi:hypothetical protein
MGDTDLVKQAEKNVVNLAKELQLVLNFMDDLANVGNRLCRQYVGQEEFFQGLKLMRNAIRKEFCEAIRDCFAFAGVGGEEAIQYAKKEFLRMFKADDTGKLPYSVMQFLETWCHHPGKYYAADEEKFKEELKAACKRAEEE